MLMFTYVIRNSMRNDNCILSGLSCKVVASKLGAVFQSNAVVVVVVVIVPEPVGAVTEVEPKGEVFT